MCWQDYWCCDGPGSFHILAWSEALKLVAMVAWPRLSVQCPRLIFWTGTLSLNPVRSGQTQRSTSRPQLMSKSDLILSKSLFLAQLRYGDTAVWHCLVLFPFIPPPRHTPKTSHRKIKHLHIFCQSPSLFSFHSLCGSQEWVQLTGTQWVSISTFFSANHSSLKVADRSSLTMTLSNR